MPCVAALLAVPVDAVDGIVGRQFPICLAGVVVDRTERPHASVCDVGTIFLRDVIVLGGDPGGILSKLDQRRVEPVDEEPLDMIPVALDRPLAPVLAHQRNPVALPSLLERDTHDLRGLLLYLRRNRRLDGPLRAFRVMTATDLRQIVLGDRPGGAGRQLGGVADCDPDGRCPLSLLAKVALGVERLLARSDDEEAFQVSIADKVASLFGR